MQTQQTPFDVAVFGAGAAGITIARQLSAAGMNVALVEGGGRDASAESQILYDGDLAGYTYALTGSRLRFFGGTTNHWGGWCRPLTEHAFQPNAAINYPGWAFARREIEPYLETALRILDIEPDVSWERDPTQADTPFDRAIAGSDLEEVYWHWSAPTRFKNKYMEELEADPNITVTYNDSLVNLTYDAGGEITGALLRNILNGEERTVTARRYVLACGGIENARLLLHINAENDTNFGNESGMLGRHFMEHPHMLDVGRMIVTQAGYEHQSVGREYRFFNPTNTVLERANLLPYTIRMSLRLNEETASETRRELAQLITLPLNNRLEVYKLSIVGEQLPNADSRITLNTDERDDLGIPRVVLDWRLSDIDWTSMRFAAAEFSRLMALSGMGRCHFEPWVFDENIAPPEPGWGHHHMGTTRMSASGRDGVVDVNSRLHGTRNFYVAGSSVFPTGGYANPTLTIVQMSLRLADHLVEIAQE